MPLQERLEAPKTPPARNAAPRTPSPHRRRKVEATEVKDVVVPVRHVRFTQGSIGSRFRDGRTFSQLVEDLISGEKDPLKERFLHLEAVCVRGKYFSLANRRLHCLKIYQNIVTADVMVRLKVTDVANPTLTDFLCRYTSRCSGADVHVRGAPQERTSLRNGWARDSEQKRQRCD